MTAIARFIGLTFPLILFAQQAPSPEPVIPLLQPDTTDPLERIRRDARAKVFHTCAQPLPLTLGPGEEFEQLAIATPTPLPQLPVAESDAVVAGQVTGLKVFLSANKKCLYTEYTFQVEDVGKPGVGIIAVMKSRSWPWAALPGCRLAAFCGWRSAEFLGTRS